MHKKYFEFKQICTIKQFWYNKSILNDEVSMKKIGWSILSLAFVFLLIACGNTKSKEPISVYLYIEVDALFERIETLPGVDVELPMPNKEGHYFVGWYLDELLTQPIPARFRPTIDTSLYAHFEINQYLIHFETFGGFPIESILIEYAFDLSQLNFGIKTAFQIVEDRYLALVFLSTYDGLVEMLYFEEYFLPILFTELHDPLVSDEDIVEIHTVSLIEEETVISSKYFAKYFKMHHMLFTAVILGTSPIDDPESEGQTIDYINQYDQYLSDLLLEESFIYFYKESIVLNDIYLSDAFGDLKEYPIMLDYFEYQLKKSHPEYWGPSSDSLGWQGNISAIIQAFKGTNMNKDETTFERVLVSDRLYWKMGDIITGATTNHFISYYELAQHAYESEGRNIPFRMGYQFVGWFLDETYTQPFILTHMPSHDITLYAKWIPN